MTFAAQMVIDVMALVGGWHIGGAAGRYVTRRRRKASSPRPYGAIPVPWQYRPAAFKPNNAPNREE